MRYRRLGTTDLMVSEVGVEVRALLEGGEEAAAAALRAAIDGGVTVFAWDVSDSTEDVEPLLARAAGVDRGRLTLIAVLDVLPPAEQIGPQVDAIAARLAEGGADGYLDIVAFPDLPDAAQLAALQEVRARGVAHHVGYAGEGDTLPADLPPGVDVLVLGGAPSGERDGVGVIARAKLGEASALLEGGVFASVVTPALDASEVSKLLVPSY